MTRNLYSHRRPFNCEGSFDSLCRDGYTINSLTGPADFITARNKLILVIREIWRPIMMDQWQNDTPQKCKGVKTRANLMKAEILMVWWRIVLSKSANCLFCMFAPISFVLVRVLRDSEAILGTLWAHRTCDANPSKATVHTHSHPLSI